MNYVREQFAFTEKYRPQTIEDCILPEETKRIFRDILAQKNIPNMLFTGSAGTGKTTVAKALARELGAEVLVLNASDENGIEVLRTKIKNFATSYSFEGARRLVILDEADYLSNATQPALRAFMEDFAKTCSFILTCNFPQRVIAPIHSRCSLVDFKIPLSDKPAMAKAFIKRAIDILTAESVVFNPAVIKQVVLSYFPDFRRTLNELQRFSSGGVLSEAILQQMSDSDIQALFDTLKERNFDAMRKWLAAHEIESTQFYSMLYREVPKRVRESCLSELIIVMADYAYRSALAPDGVLNALACLIEIRNIAQWV